MVIKSMAPDADEEVREAALQLTDSVAAYWERKLENNLLGVYLLGSLAHGGFNRRYSDIDIGLVSEVALTNDMLEGMRSFAKSMSPDLASKISLFWSDRSFVTGWFPPLDRLAYLDHSMIVMERVAVRPDRPTLENIRDYLCGAPFENWDKAARKFAQMQELEEQNHKAFLRAFLYAARFVFSWATGKMASNDDAMAFIRAEPQRGLDVPLLEQAFQIRLDAADPDPLFKYRKSLLNLVEACALICTKTHPKYRI